MIGGIRCWLRCVYLVEGEDADESFIGGRCSALNNVAGVEESIYGSCCD